MTRLSSLLLLLVSSLLPAAEPIRNQVDAIIEKHARTEKVSLSPTADDAEFLRRIRLDLTGKLPTSVEVRTFLKDTSASKRQAHLQELLASPAYAKHLANVFHIMLMERQGDHPDWTTYLEASFQQNKPWDTMAREMLRADAKELPQRGANFFLAKRLDHYGQNPVDYSGLTRDVGRLFLGKNFQCCECHDHLTVDEYKQRDFQGLHAFLLNTNLEDLKTLRVSEKPLLDKLSFASVFTKVQMLTAPAVPGGMMLEIPKFAKGEEFSEKPDRKTKNPGVPKFRTLLALSDELPKNKSFARNIVNRVWFNLMGRGLVHPLDLHHAANPASHPEVLQVLSEEFVQQKYNLKWLHATILSTRAYQRSSQLVPGSQPSRPELFAFALEKRLSAEQLYQAFLQATDTKPSEPLKAKFLKVYANQPREPEEEITPSLKATLFLLNDTELQNLLVPRAEKLALLKKPEAIADELYLSVFSRFPTTDETATVKSVLAKRGEPGIKLLLWSLLASQEFCTNH